MENFKQHERGREMLFLKMKHSITVERGGLGVNIWSFLSCLSSHCFSLPVSEETSSASVFVFAEAFHGLGHCFNLSPLFPSRPIPSHACQCYDSPTLTDTCIKNRCSKADISLAIIVLITQLHFFFNRWYLSCCSNSAYFFIMSSFSQVSLLKASTSPAATLLHLHWY